MTPARRRQIPEHPPLNSKSQENTYETTELAREPCRNGDGDGFPSLFAYSHREAPLVALDRGADVTDWYAFVSYDHPDRVTMILNVEGFLEPSNGPNYFPFNPNVRYVMNVDNSQSGKTDI
jgi:hypothetical protein